MTLNWHMCYLMYHCGQMFAHARLVVRAELQRLRKSLSLSAFIKTEEKFISERLHKALEKRVNKIMRG